MANIANAMRKDFENMKKDNSILTSAPYVILHDWFISVNGTNIDIHVKDGEGYEKTICQNVIDMRTARAICDVHNNNLKNRRYLG